jgi:HK97 family phage portal protein
MGFFRRRERVEDRALTPDSLQASMALPGLAVGEPVPIRSATSLSSVFACCRVLCDAAVLAPLQTFRKSGDGSRVQIESGRTYDLLQRPAPALTGEALVARMMMSLALHGETLVGKLKEDGQVVSLEVLDPLRVTVEIRKGQPFYSYTAPMGTLFEDLTPADVCHVVGVTDAIGVRGLSPIAACREAFSLASHLSTSASATWLNQAMPSGLLRVGQGPSAQDQAHSLADAWRARHGGPERRGRIAVVTGDIEFQAISMSPEDAQFIETSRMSLAEVARIFGIPPSRVNAASNDSMTYSTTLAESTQFVTTALAPRLKLIESALSNDSDLCSQPTYLEFNLDGLLRGDALTRATIYSMALSPQTGWMTRAECRELENLPPEEETPPQPAAPVPVKEPTISSLIGLANNGGGGAAG